ncbi:MAG: redox-sensing transcriptional repressor Rex [Kiritimatiellia bacterium]
MHNKNCIMRLSRYRSALTNLKLLNFNRVFSDNLADAAGATSAQVRKDFSIFGLAGNRRGGYLVDELIAQLDKILGKDKVQKFILVGAGNMGKALMNYPGFEKNSIRIIAAFDIDQTKLAPNAGTPVLPLEQVKDFIAKNSVQFAIICVPVLAAPQVSEILLSAGIRGILNFAPIRLKDREGCVIENINLVTELENIIYFVKALDSTNA